MPPKKRPIWSMPPPHVLARSKFPINMPNNRNLTGNLQRNVEYLRAIREAQLEQSRIKLFENNSNNENNHQAAAGTGLTNPNPAATVPTATAGSAAAAPTHVKINAFKGAKATISANVKKSNGGRRKTRRRRY